MLDKINGKVSIGMRLALVSGLFLTSSVAVTALLARNESEDLTFSEKERTGVAYLRDVWAAVRNGGAVDAAVATEEFDASAAAQDFMHASSDEERFNAGLALIVAVADGSNLTLDPELDSFYAMDAATVKLPALLSAAMDVEAAAAAARADASKAETLSFAIRSFNSALSAADASIASAIGHNKDGQSAAALSAPTEALKAAAAAYVNAATSASAAEFTQADADLDRAADQAWSATAGELARLLDARIASGRAALALQMALVGIFLAVAGALAFLVSTGLSRRFKDLTAVMDRLRGGDFKVDVPYTDDAHETGAIAGTLQTLRDDLAARVAADARRIEEAEIGAEGLAKAISRAQAMIEFKPDGTIVSANENFLNAIGYRLEEIVGQHHSMFVDPGFRQSPDYRAFWDKLGRGDLDSGKYLRIGRNGRQIWLQASYNPIADRSGKVVKVVKFATDVTEAENIAREAVYKGATFDNSMLATTTIDRDFKITYVNEAALRLFRANIEKFRKLWPTFNPDTLVGTCIDAFHKNPAHQRQLLADPSRLPVKADISVDDIKIELNVTAIFDGQRRYVGNALTWEDVTQRRLNAGMLAALDRAQAIIEFDVTGKILFANENFCRAMGYTLDEIRGQHHSMFVDSAYRQSAEYRAFWEKLGRGEFESGKFRRIARGGREVWIQGAYNPILDATGRPFKVVKFADDVTQIENDRTRAEEERAARAEEQALVVRGLAGALRQLSDGDLTAKVHENFPGEYEQLRADFNVAVERLHEAMSAIVANAGGMRSGVGEISQAADDLSRRTEQQAASLEETAAALDEITATVRKTADGALQANSVVAGARRDAEASGEVVREAVTAMSEIEKSSKQISQIIGVIDEIAFQTNLLALNAGVEAARAGEAGRGFAVVASEVRALAQRSSEAAKEIKGLISTSSQHVETGVELVDQTGQALRQIVGKVSEISTLVSEISASAQEQSTGLVQVNTAINQMDQVTQQNAAMVEQSTAASHSLRQEAEEMMRLVARFKTAAAHEPLASAPARGSVGAQKRRVAEFVASRGATAVKMPSSDDDWQEF